MKKLALIISFYNESVEVEATIKALHNYNKDSATICVQSDCCNNPDWIVNNATAYTKLPNLALSMHKYLVPSEAVCRNYSVGSSLFKQLDDGSYDYIIYLLGDTYIYDFSELVARLDKVMVDKNAAVLQAIGQNFHAMGADPISGICGGRYQHDEIRDIMPQFFAIRGSIGALPEIKNINKWTSEENLGIALSSIVSRQNTVRLNEGVGAYSFYSGLKLQIRG